VDLITLVAPATVIALKGELRAIRTEIRLRIIATERQLADVFQVWLGRMELNSKRCKG
jgi:hypothetical protein